MMQTESLPRKRVFLLGHGAIVPSITFTPSSPEGKNLQKVSFYVKPEKMLDRFMIPGIFQTLLSPPPFTYEELISNRASRDDSEAHSLETGTNHEHALFLLDNENMINCKFYRSFERYFQPWNSADQFRNGYSLTLNDPFFKLTREIGIDGITLLEYKTDKAGSFFSNDILIQPKLMGQQGVSQVVRLSKICQWMQNAFEGEELEYHWLACREKDQEIELLCQSKE